MVVCERENDAHEIETREGCKASWGRPREKPKVTFSIIESQKAILSLFG
jgi:hypothetical protein